MGAPFVTRGLNQPRGLACDSQRFLHIADGGNNTLTRSAPAGATSTVSSGNLRAPTSIATPTTDGTPLPPAAPSLTVFAGSTAVASNENWGGVAQVTAIGNAVGAFGVARATSRAASLAARDCTIQVSRAGGRLHRNDAAAPAKQRLGRAPNTAQISGVGNTTGVALVEIYVMPQR